MNKRISVSILIAICAAGLEARAALGDKEASIEKDKVTLSMSSGPARQMKNFAYEDLMSTTAGPKLKIRQFISNDGQVFAVAWSGRMNSQVETVLGAYATDFSNHETANPPRTGRIPYRKVVAGRVTVEQWDILRRIQGKAYVPGLIPAGVTPQQLQIND